MNKSHSQTEQEDIAINLGVHYNIGTSQKHPVHIPTFLQWNHGDLAVKVSGFGFASL